ncbi:ABC transporter permease [Streptomyces sp. E-08]|uniref:ABC transporter permease n=1 Tax=Streptomyces sp. E-08 TaxID=3404047 RepID=UPI003CFADBC0
MNLLADGWTLTRRRLFRLRHEPGTLLTMLMMPTVFVVLFGFVFGGAIGVPGTSNYREFMMPGLFVVTTGTALSTAMVEVATDQARGVMERLRSLPTHRVSVPLGQSGAEGILGAYGLAVLMVCGLVVGWRPRNGVLPALAGIGLLLLFRYTLAWVGTYLGLMVRSARTAARLAPFALAPALVSNALVPTDRMPAILRAVCEWNPLSSAAAAVRELFGNPGAPGPDAAWPLTHPVTASLLWAGLLLLIFVPLSARSFARAGL